jgi:hypothetical protein
MLDEARRRGSASGSAAAATHLILIYACKSAQRPGCMTAPELWAFAAVYSVCAWPTLDAAVWKLNSHLKGAVQQATGVADALMQTVRQSALCYRMLSQ